MAPTTGAEAAGADLDRGRKVGKYEILTRLSMGGMAELFLAYTSGPGGFRKYVAVKQILPDVKKDEQFVKMFLDEARITAAFSHGNIGQVFELGEEAGEFYLAMEFIAGQNLEQVVKRASLKKHPLPVGFGCRVVRDACLGLHYAHSFSDQSGKPAPVIHRDVSPKNVMVTYSGDVKMIDFGIAKAKNRLGRTQVGMVKGTSGYMSPEQVKNLELDGRSDLFSVGVMLHELLTGQRLFDAPSEAAVMIAIVEGEISSPRKLNPKVPEALSAVVMRALAQDRDQRFSSGKELAKAIEQASAGIILDEDGVAEQMKALFKDKIQTTRAMLDLANEGAEDLSKVAGALHDDPSDSPQSATPRGRPPSSASATPSPRDPNATLMVRRPTGKSNPAIRSRSNPAMRPREEEAPTSAPAKEEPVRPRRHSAPSQPAVQQPEAEPDPESEPDSDGIGLSGLWVVLGLVGVLGIGAGALATLDVAAPVREGLLRFLGREPVAAEPDVEPGAAVAIPDPSIKPPPVGPPPSLDPAAGAVPEPVDAPPGDVAKAGAPPVDAPPLGAQPGDGQPGDGQPGDGQPVDAQPGDGQPGDGQPGDGQPGDAPPVGKAAGDQPVDSVQPVPGKKQRDPGRRPARVSVGWLSLMSIPPTSVFEGPKLIGKTPLAKLPLSAGKHSLSLVDPKGKKRRLLVSIKSGQTTQMKIRVTDLPLDN